MDRLAALVISRFLQAELDVYLNDPGKVPGIGPEKGSKPKGNGIAKYQSPHGSTRYVAYIEGSPVAALQVVSQDGKNATMSNLFTAPEHRREGWATKLLERARKDFKTVVFPKEEHISTDAKAWREKVR